MSKQQHASEQDLPLFRITETAVYHVRAKTEALALRRFLDAEPTVRDRVLFTHVTERNIERVEKP
jgi:hypothetical protein